jgi:hypothetical protein
LNNKPDLKIIVKPLAWLVVITGWIFYGLVIWEQVTHPRPEKDPVTDFQEGLKSSAEHWQFSLFMLCMVLLYVSCWVFIKEEKETKKRKEQNETRQ